MVTVWGAVPRRWHWCVAMTCLLLAPRNAPCAPVERSCALFGEGVLATALAVSGTLDFEVHTMDAEHKAPSIRLEGDPQSCHVFLSGNRFAALGVNIAVGNHNELQVLVFDRDASRWVSNFVVTGQRMEGFLRDTSKLVFTKRTGSKDSNKADVEISIFALDGAKEASSVRTVPHSIAVWGADSVDPKHNRLWFIGTPTFCPFMSTTLVGDIAAGPSISQAAAGGDCSHKL